MNQSPLALLFFFFYVQISLRTPIALCKPCSLCSGQQADCGRAFPDESDTNNSTSKHLATLCVGRPPPHPPIHPPTPSLEVSLLSFAVYFSSNLCEVHDNEHSFCFPPVSPLPCHRAHTHVGASTATRPSSAHRHQQTRNTGAV